MAKKKKRADFSAPSTAKKTAARAADKVADGAETATGAATSAADKVASTGKSAKAAATSSGKPAKSGSAGKSAKPAARRSGGGMSSNTQWAMVIGAMALIIGGVLLFSILGAGGGSGVLEINAWDIPARADDTDNGDDDGRIKLADFNGTPTVVNFFASWCAECDAELPYFTDLGEQYSDQVDMVFVNANESSGEWREMMDRHDIIGNFPVGRDIKGTNRNGLIRNLGGSTGMPATAFFDANGRMVKFTNGLVEQGTLQRELLALGVEL